MATTHQPEPDLNPQAADQSGGENALEWFEDVIWHDFRVCNNCFAQVKRRMCGQITKPDGQRIDVDESWRTPIATLGEDAEDPPGSSVSRQPVHRPRTTCEHCGSVGAIAMPDTLSRRAALDRVDNLAARLRERGYDADRQTIRAVVRQLKSSEDHASDDKHVFATAASLGIRR